MTHSQFIWVMTGATFLAVVVVSVLGLHVAGNVSRILRHGYDRRIVPDRRSSKRREVSLPIFVYGHSEDAEPFFEDATVEQVSAHGALLKLISNVQIGQELLLARNGDQELHRSCRVARVGPSTNSGTAIAIRFAAPAPEFWADESMSPVEPVASHT